MVVLVVVKQGIQNNEVENNSNKWFILLKLDFELSYNEGYI